MGILSRYRPEVITTVTCLLYISVGGLMNSALNNPADDINAFIEDSFVRRYNETISDETAAWMWSSVIFTFMVGSFAGSLFSHQLADRLGRKPTLMHYSSSLYLLAATAFYLAKPLDLFELIIVGRLITGISNGVANPILATYLVESIPEDLTGFAGSMLDFSGCVGSFLGIALSTDAILGNPDRWHHLLGGPCLVFGSLQIFTSVIFCETPKFLLLHRNHREKAGEAVAFFYGERVSEAEVTRKLSTFRNYEADVPHVASVEPQQNDIAIRPKRREKLSRSKTILLSAALGTLPLACGYTILLNYSTEILQLSGLSQNTSQIYTTIMGIFEVFGSIGSLIVNYRSPRRLVLIFCTILCLFFMMAMILLLSLNTYFPSRIYLHATGVTISLVSAMTVVGPFPLYLLLPAEFAQQKLRAMATSVATGAYYLISIVTLLTFYPLFKMIGAYSMIPAVGVGFVILPLVYRYLPETSPTVENGSAFPSPNASGSSDNSTG